MLDIKSFEGGGSPDLHGVTLELVDRLDGIVAVAEVFANSGKKPLLAPAALEAARLFDLAARAQGEASPEQRTAALALDSYLASADCPVQPEEMEYVKSLLGDVPTIIEAAGAYAARVEPLLEELDDDVRSEAGATLAALTGRDVSATALNNVRFGIDFPHIVSLANEVNVESIVIMAVMKLHEMVSVEMSDSDRQRAVFEVESFYAPLVTALDLAPLGTALRNEANRIRLLSDGHTDMIAQARASLAPVNEIGFGRVVQEIVGEIDEAATIEEVVACMVSGGVIHFGQSDISNLTDGQHEGELSYRQKTLYSCAQKMQHNEDYKERLPQDIAGLTAVLKDVPAVARYMAYVFNGLTDEASQDKIELVPAPSKDKPIFIQGNFHYIATMLAELAADERVAELMSDSILESVDPEQKQRFIAELTQHLPLPMRDNIQVKLTDGKPINETYRVLKMTFNVIIDGHKIPVEEQFHTEYDYYNASYGATSHAGYKGNDVKGGAKSKLNQRLGNIPGDANSLGIINQRRLALQEMSAESLSVIQSASAQKFNHVLAAAHEQHKQQVLYIGSVAARGQYRTG